MDSPPKLSGDTLLVHHIPLVHCQVPGRQCCSSVKRPASFCPPDNLGLTRTTSLPERDVLPREALVYSSLIQTSSSSCSSGVGGEGGGMEGGGRRGFAPEPFLLSGGRSWCAMGHVTGEPQAAHDRDRIGALKAANRLEALDLSGFECQNRHGSSGSTLSMDCGEQEWGEEEEEDDAPQRGGRRIQASCSCSSSCDFAPPSSSRRCCCCYCGLPEPFSEPFPEGAPGYGSDSSCNSSDGVLVNFSAIYNKMNNGVPAKPNLNSSAEQSCTSSSSEPGGAFYLDLHGSPAEPRAAAGASSQDGAACPSSCGCRSPEALDANCNSYHLPCDGLSAEVSDLTACLQSQVRLAVATQNYYKLVTCDLSSQSSPSPPGSSIGSCSEEHNQASSPTQATEYYLFRRPEEHEGEETAQDEEDLSRLVEDEDEERTEQGGPGPPQNALGGQLFVSPLANGRDGCGTDGTLGGAAGRARSRSYDRNFDRPPSPRLGSLERMLSCPVHLSESSAQSPPPAPPRVTSFAEIARSKRRNGSGAGGGGSPSLRASTEATSTSSHSQSSQEHSPIPELSHIGQSHSLPPMTFPHCYGQGGDTPSHSNQQGVQRDSPGREPRTKAEGGSSSSADVVRYSKDQRPTTLPIQPFTFQHQVGKSQAKPLRPLLNEYVSQMYSRPTGQPAPDSVRPSPLGSYSPVRLQGVPSSGTCSTCTPPSPEPSHSGPQPPRSLSCPLQAGLLPVRTSPSPAPIHESRPKQVLPPPTPPPAPLKKELPPPTLSSHCLHRNPLTSLPPLSDVATTGFSSLGKLEPTAVGSCAGIRAVNVHHLSPQALKWREYRRKNPLGVERASGGSCAPPLSGSLDAKRGGEGRLARRNVFDFPASFSHAHTRPSGSESHTGQCIKQLQNYYSDFLPDYFSLTEKPPEEFCLSPDATSESISIDLLQKRGLVKAINTSVDLIVAHFGTSRDPGVKAKLGNSSVSPNVGHLILKYLCPAIRDVLQDGLRAYVLDLIIGQRRNQPWSVVEASTQLGPSTRVLHSLFSKVSQYSELTSHNMRLNAFVFGLLNLRSLEFWFHHLYTHEDIVAAHYHPWGFLPLSQGVCQPLFEELLLLLQPLSLLPFDLDLLFEPRLLQRSQEHLRRKEQLCSAGQGLEHSVRSTFQLMRGWGAGGAESKQEGVESRIEVGAKRERTDLRLEGLRTRREGAEPRRSGKDQQREKTGRVKEVVVHNGKDVASKRTEPQKEGQRKSTESGLELWNNCGVGGTCKNAQRMKGVGGETGHEPEDGDRRRERGLCRDGPRHRDRNAGWWYQLMQSSQVYIDSSAEGSKFVKWEKRKRPPGELAGGRWVENGMGCRQSHPPLREGVVEGAEASQEGEGLKGERTEPRTGVRGKPSWMGSPPESVLTDLKRSKEKDTEKEEEPAGTLGDTTQGLRWGRLFGAGVRSSPQHQKAEQRPKSRLPSDWLSLDKSMLDLMAQTVGAGKLPDLSPPFQNQALPPAQQPEAQTIQDQRPREVRALCHHIATQPGHLSFNKGDILRVLSQAEPDWLHCTLGDREGLVPLIYVTLNEESQGPH
ncbi:hypothetical protein JZ751_011888 [Albula glossodonta]|uniref:RUN and SH3 domain containing 2 n=1 Tax=Albula glossodonta TaxID=121402 RepID=A0A8T2PQY3_9TELE|nr:hypothetical protein JZ751_011888 [Albula glossodonta]